MKVKLKGNEYEIKNGLKAMLVFEALTEKPFAINDLTDLCKYEYCMVYANNDGFSMDFNDFLDELENEDVQKAFSEAMNMKQPLDTKKKTKAKG